MGLKNILLVEDEKDILMLGTMSLQDIGAFTVKTAADGKEALEILKDWVPDLIIMDVVMPILSGTETVKILQQDETLKKIPVFFLTAKSEDVVFDAYYALGVKEVFMKPFDPLNLAQVIQKAYDKLGDAK